jgi:hypothetical protein
LGIITCEFCAARLIKSRYRLGPGRIKIPVGLYAAYND